MLYFAPTPIGNLGDISARCLDILKASKVIICEDTRVGKSLFNLLGIPLKEKNFFCLNSHNFQKFISSFDTARFSDEICAFISDAGMPCISDPGYELVKFSQNNQINYEVLPGANAALLAAAASGIVKKEFSFFGFLANTNPKREQDLNKALNSQIPVIIYESPKRVLDLVQKIALLEPNKELFAIKEATKKFETKFFGTAAEVAGKLESANLNGEWALVLAPKENQNTGAISTDDILALDVAPKIKAKLLSKLTGQNTKKIYENLIK